MIQGSQGRWVCPMNLNTLQVSNADAGCRREVHCPVFTQSVTAGKSCKQQQTGQKNNSMMHGLTGCHERQPGPAFRNQDAELWGNWPTVRDSLRPANKSE